MVVCCGTGKPGCWKAVCCGICGAICGGICCCWRRRRACHLVVVVDGLEEVNQGRFAVQFRGWRRSLGGRRGPRRRRLVGKQPVRRLESAFLALFLGEIVAAVRVKVLVVEVLLQRVPKTRGGVLDLGDLEPRRVLVQPRHAQILHDRLGLLGEGPVDAQRT